MDKLIAAIKKLEKNLPHGPINEYWEGYKEAIDDLWLEVSRLEKVEAK